MGEGAQGSLSFIGTGLHTSALGASGAAIKKGRGTQAGEQGALSVYHPVREPGLRILEHPDSLKKPVDSVHLQIKSQRKVNVKSPFRSLSKWIPPK